MATFNLNLGHEAATGLNENDTFNFGGGSSFNTALGGGGNDTFNTNSAANSNQMFGGDGDDVWALHGAGGRQSTFNGGAGYDWADFRDYAFGSTVFDFSGSTVGHGTGFAQPVFFGTIERNFMVDIEAIAGSQSADTFIGGAADMRFDGFGGRDVATGGTGSVTFVGGEGSDDLTAGSGAVNLIAGSRWLADGTYIADTGRNTLAGGSGAFDAIIAGSRGDDITVGTGNIAYIRLGEGQDTVHASGAEKFAGIDNFQTTRSFGNAHDVLDLASSTGIHTFDQLLAASTEYTGQGTFGTIIKTAQGDQIYLNGVHKTSLLVTDFAFH